MKQYYDQVLNNKWSGFFVVILTAAVYLAVCQADFVLDDYFLIKNNRYLQSDLWTLLLGDLWVGEPHPVTKSTFYRPIFTLSIFLDQQLGDGDPFWFHLHSLGWHLLAVFLLYRFLLVRFSPPAAFWGSIFFALHPIQSEVVIWISARNDSMSAVFALVAMMMLCDKSLKTSQIMLGVLAVTLAFLSKENTLAIPLWIWLCAHDRKWTRAGWAASGIAFALLLRSMADVGSEIPDAVHWQLFVERCWYMFAIQLRSLIWPWPMSPMLSLPWLSVSVTTVALAILTLGILFCAAKKRSQMIVLAVVIALSAYLPTLWAVVVNGAFGDRYMYLPMVGLSILLAANLQTIPRLVVCFPVIWLIMIGQRLPDWKDDVSLWESVVRDYPSAHSRASLAHIYYNQREFAMAAYLYRQAFADPVPYLSGCDTYVTSVLKSEGPQAALLAASWAQEHGCPLRGQLAGVMSIAMASLGEWEELRRLLASAPADYSKRDLIARGALAIVDGEFDTYVLLRDKWKVPSKFEQQVQELLRRAGYKIHIPRLPVSHSSP